MGQYLGELTSSGSTDAVVVKGNTSHTLQINVTAVTTSIDYNILGSLDGTNYFDLESTNVQKTATGVFYLSYSDLPLTHIKGSFEAGTGTLQFTYQGNTN